VEKHADCALEVDALQLDNDSAMQPGDELAIYPLPPCAEPDSFLGAMDSAQEVIESASWGVAYSSGFWHRVREYGQSVAASLLREVMGNPILAPFAIDLAWLEWNDRTIPKLSQAIYDDRAFDGLPILADALEEAGCANAAILDHCRLGGEHVRGCWVVDLLLGKS
jgi:hypothetical protein